LGYATVQGFALISMSKENPLRLSFWVLAVCFFLSLGIFWSNQMYVSWQEHPVLTTIKMTGFSIKDVEFPSVTFCSKSTSDLSLNLSHITLFLNFLANNYGIKSDFSPFNIAELLSLVSVLYIHCKFKRFAADLLKN
jgi:hypothetical protein